MSDNIVNRGGPDRSPVDARELLERWMSSRARSTQGVGNSLGDRVRWMMSQSRADSGNRQRAR